MRKQLLKGILTEAELAKLNEDVVESSEIFSGKILDLKLNEVSLADGSHSKREVIIHSGGAAVLAINDNDEIALVFQYRAGCSEVVCELPAGKVERDEEPIVCAKRELLEECGMVSDDWTLLNDCYPSPAYVDEVISVFLAKNCRKVAEKHLDEGEYLSFRLIDFKQALAWVLSGDIKDAKTQIGILSYAVRKFED